MMVKVAQTERGSRAMNVKGAVPSGLTKKTVSGLERKVEDVFQQNGAQVRVRGMRFIPSTKVDLGAGAFEVLANTVVEFVGNENISVRPEAFDSVVTVGRVGQRGQRLKGIKIPALERVDG